MTSRPASSSDFPVLDPKTIETIIVNDEQAQKLVETAEAWGKALARPLSTNQIRSIYGEVLRIKADWLDSRDDAERQNRAKRALVLLKPKMAYRAQKERGKGPGVEQLVKVLTLAIDNVKGDPKRFRHFVEFFESILAYHKANGGN